MLPEFTSDYLLNKKVKIFQPVNGYRASTDAVLLAAMPEISKPNMRILDVGSGTGAISLCLAERFKEKNVQIEGIEIQEELANLANYSAEQNNFDFLHFYNLDIRSKLKNEKLAPCSFDIVISNPPYSDHDMPSPNPSKATAHNHTQFNLNLWLEFCLKMAKPFGKIYMVNRVEALPEICQTFYGRAGNITILPLYSKENQNAKRILLSAQKDSKAPCQILPPFYVHNDKGEYTQEAQKVLREGLSFAEIIKII